MYLSALSIHICTMDCYTSLGYNHLVLLVNFQIIILHLSLSGA